MAVKVKICGLTRPQDALATAQAGADFAGLVFHPGSPRYVSPDKARAISEKLSGRVRVVALFVNPADDIIVAAIAAAKPDFLQLHGQEPARRVAEIRARFGIPVMKAIGIADEHDVGALAGFEAAADMLLFDAKAADGASGGRGVAFDWQLLRKRTIRKPWLLAGGLNVQNVARAVAAAGAPGVDVSSGVETSPGVKDAEAIRAFVEAARMAEFAAGGPA
ncbi:MAG TPA: phosphoribosylanthranilate isomerase [Rhizomicrobium sp.]|jgi:phosphoribosylanthranilate isomerase|nr:phosphoribosylanthranilate isomerase [Rhizomicrobium sp.]